MDSDFSKLVAKFIESRKEHTPSKWRSFNEGETVIVTSEGSYPKADFKEGTITGGYKLIRGNNKYEVYIPELDRSYWIMATFLTPVEDPTEAQLERFMERGIRTSLGSTKRKKSFRERLEEESLQTLGTYSTDLDVDESARLHHVLSALGEIPKPYYESSEWKNLTKEEQEAVEEAKQELGLSEEEDA